METYTFLAVVEDENGTRYTFSAMEDWSDAFIVDQATGFYGVFMTRLISKERI